MNQLMKMEPSASFNQLKANLCRDDPNRPNFSEVFKCELREVQSKDPSFNEAKFTASMALCKCTDHAIQAIDTVT